jgi:hypothetical protein
MQVRVCGARHRPVRVARCRAQEPPRWRVSGAPWPGAPTAAVAACRAADGGRADGGPHGQLRDRSGAPDRGRCGGGGTGRGWAVRPPPPSCSAWWPRPPRWGPAAVPRRSSVIAGGRGCRRGGSSPCRPRRSPARNWPSASCTWRALRSCLDRRPAAAGLRHAPGPGSGPPAGDARRAGQEEQPPSRPTSRRWPRRNSNSPARLVCGRRA